MSGPALPHEPERASIAWPPAWPQRPCILTPLTAPRANLMIHPGRLAPEHSSNLYLPN
jgi:hypothetical protein